MKICRDCSNACEQTANVCSRCGSTNLTLVAEKHCVYCKTRVVIGTIICPHCHRILPPESEDIQATTYQPSVGGVSTSQTAGASVGLANVNAGESQRPVAESDNIKYVQPITHISEMQTDDGVKATTYGENISSAPQPKKAESTSGISEYNKQNPLFEIYDKAPDILPVTKTEGVPASTYAQNMQADDELQTDVANLAEVSEGDGYNNTGVLQTKAYQTQRVSREEEKPQSKLPRMLIFLLGCVYTIIGLFTTYMVHDIGNIIGWEMACSVIIALRDVFPSAYPYILYGSSFLSRFETIGSYMPFYLDHAIMFSLFAGITMMISAVPKWVVAVLHFVVLACHIGGIYVMVFLFGFGCVGVGAYIFAIGSLAVAVLHLIFVGKVYKFKKI